MKYQTILSQMLLITTLANARFAKWSGGGAKAASTVNLTMQLICTEGMPAIGCHGTYRTNCTSDGVMQNPAPSYISKNGDCTPAHCSCRMAPPIPCVTGFDGSVFCGEGITMVIPAPSGASTTVTFMDVTYPTISMTANSTGGASTTGQNPGSFCATKTTTVTVTHFRSHNGTHSTFTSGNGQQNRTTTRSPPGSSSTMTSETAQVETSTLSPPSSSSNLAGYTTITDLPAAPFTAFQHSTTATVDHGASVLTLPPSQGSGSPSTKMASASSLTILTIGGIDY